MQTNIDPTTVFSNMHPANIKAGMIFNDTDRDGAICTVLALRDAKLMPSGKYRIIGLHRESDSVRMFGFHPEQNVHVTGSTNHINVTIDAFTHAMNDDDPMIAERDNAEEVVRDTVDFGDEQLDD